MAVLAFATWTLIAFAGMATGAPATLLVLLWAPTVPLVAVALGGGYRRSVGRSLGPEPSGRDTRRLDARSYRALAAASVAGGVGCAALIAVRSVPWRASWPVIWTPAAIGVGLAVAVGRLGSRPSTRDSPPPAFAADALAAVVSLGLAVMSLFINNGDRDDAFYVNRATATAQLNRIPVRDVLFTDERIPPISGTGVPVDTLHALQGALARLVGVHGASIAYYLTPPIATFLATWALWRLLRSWSPRRAVLCFAVGCQYWLWSALLDLNPGSLFLARMWQGKVIFVAWLVPTLYVLLTRWLGRRDAVTAVLLFAAALASVGLTASATLVAPLVFATAALAMAARRQWRALTVVAGAAAVPLVIGLVVTRRYPLAQKFAIGLHGNQWFFNHVFGVGVVGALGVAALCMAPWLARAGPPARIATAVAVVAVLVLAPGVLRALKDTIGLTETLRRTLWIVPLPALVGLLAAVPVHRLAAAGAALALAAALVAFGHPLWQSPTGASYWTSRPVWKTDQTNLKQARAILARYHENGPILARQGVMLAIAIQTVHPKAVSARQRYARLAPEPRRRTRERRLLTRFATTGELAPAPAIRQALSDLHVGLVCIDVQIVGRMWRLGLTDPSPRAFRIGHTICLHSQW